MCSDKKSLNVIFLEFVGYFFMVFVFTGVLYFVLHFSGKLPNSWGYFHILTFTLVLVFIGKCIRFWLKV